jgi:hypothetical protein
MGRKLGLEASVEEMESLIQSLFQILQAHSIDYTFFFREISRYEQGKPDSLVRFFNHYASPEIREALSPWLRDYDHHLAKEACTDSLRSQRLLKINPKFILRNHIAQSIIENTSGAGTEWISAWYTLLRSPFEEHPEFDRDSLPPPHEKKNLILSCSS